MTREITATIWSVKMNHAAVVVVPRVFRHPKYHKIITRKTRLHVQNDLTGLAEGDRVKIVPARPVSKLIHYRIVAKL